MAVNVQRSFLKASTQERNGDVIAARATYNTILASFPKNRRAKVAIAKLGGEITNPPGKTLTRITMLYKAKEWQSVITECHGLITEYPKSEPLWTFIGVAAQMLGHQDVAIPALLRAAEIKSTPHTCATLASAFEQACLYDRAAHWFEKAKELDPRKLDYSLSLGRVRLSLGQLDEAIKHLDVYTAKCPQSATAFAYLGEACLQSGHLKKAIDAFDTAARLNPTSAEIHHNLSVAFSANGQLDLAVQAYERVLALNPNMHGAQAQKLYFQLKMCDWRAFGEFEKVAGDLGIKGEATSPFTLLGLEDNPAHQKRRSHRYARDWTVTPRDFTPTPSDKIRIGYVSSDFFDHATLFLLNGVLEHHDRDRFEIYAYALNAPANSAEAARLRGNVDWYRDVHKMSDAQIAKLARDDGLDIAVDLKGYTRDSRPQIFCEGLAPIQISYLGYPGTMASSCMDFIIADASVIPKETRCHYTESVIYMPHSYQPNDNCRSIAQVNDSRADHNLPEDAFVLCCFNSCYKLSPAEFDIWMRVLKRCPEAVLWLLDGGENARQNLKHEAEKRGVDPRRLIFAPPLSQGDHLARHQHADLFVDTFNINAHTTASDALWAGLPLVTMAGRQFAARVSASLLQAVGLSELITHEVEAYEALILDLVRNQEKLERLRRSLEVGRLEAPLFDTQAYTGHLEAAYRNALAAARAGRIKNDIHIAP